MRIRNERIGDNDRRVEYSLSEDDWRWCENHAVFGKSGTRTAMIAKELRDLKRGDGGMGTPGRGSKGKNTEALTASAAFPSSPQESDLSKIPSHMRHLYEGGDDEADEVVSQDGSQRMEEGGAVPLWCEEGTDLPCCIVEGVGANAEAQTIRIFTMSPSVLERGMDMLEKVRREHGAVWCVCERSKSWRSVHDRTTRALYPIGPHACVNKGGRGVIKRRLASVAS